MKQTATIQKLFFVTLLIAIISLMTMPHANAQTQSCRVSVEVLNAELASMPVIGAIVEVTPEVAPEKKQYYSTDIDGKFTIPALAYGNYSMKVSFLGLENSVVTLTADSPEMTLPTVMMSASVIQMQAVVKTAKSLRASQNGDTLNYNASSFKVAADADVEGLLQKMPGIAIEDGEVTAQGETIKKIYVDGREFFGNDVAMALKSLPAEVVEKIEVYDKLSDESQYSGMDDGSGEKTINIVTKPSMRKGIFGKVFAGGGYEPDPRDMGVRAKYMGGGSANIFHDKSRISVIALVNNLNQQNFSFEDIMGMSDDGGGNTGEFMVKPLPGVANVNALGVNYSDYFGKADDGKEKVKVQMSYFINQTKTENVERIQRWYEGEATEKTDSLYQNQAATTSNLNQRINGRIDWKINKKQSLMIRPTISLQKSDPYRETSGQRYGQAYDRVKVDGVWEDRTHQEYSNIQNWTWEGYNVGASFNYRYSLGDAGNITAGGNFSFNNYDNESETTMFQNYNEVPFTYNDKTTYKYKDSPSNRRNLSGNIGYNKQIADHFSTSVTYRYSQNYQHSDSKTYTTDSTFMINDDVELVSSASNSAATTYVTHKIGPSLRFFKNKTNIVGSVNYQYSTLDSKATKPFKDSDGKYVDKDYEDDKDYKNLTYSLVGQVFFNTQNSLRVYVNSWTNNPPISRIQDIYYLNNIEYISKGNPNLDPTYTNRLKLRYIHSNLERGSTMMAYVSAEKTDNYMATHIVYNPGSFVIPDYNDNQPLDPDEVVQYTTYVNLNDYWNFYGNLNYGMPLEFMKCNLNISGGISYSIIPSIYGGTANADGYIVNSDGTINGGEENTINKMSYRAGLTLGSNISENVDFTLQWRGRYNEAANAIVLGQTEPTMNKYYDQVVTASCKFVFLKGFTFSGSYNFQQYKGITNTYNDIYNICNAYIGHKLGAQQRGEIIAGVSDIFDQNTSFNRTVGNSYTDNKINTVLGRYYSVQFIYNMRFFGKGASTNMKDYGMGKKKN